MKKIILLTTLAALSICAQAQTSRVNIKSKGDDIRLVIASIFEQANQQYVMETSARQSLFMSLEGISLEKAIEIVSNVAELSFTKKDGVWFVNSRRGTKTAVKPPTPTAFSTKDTSAHKFVPEKTEPTKNAPPVKTGSKVVIPAAKIETSAKSIPTSSGKKVDLTARLTTKFQKTDIREVLEEFGRQAGVDIQVMDSVPNYKIDAFMFNTSLKFALERVCSAAKLKYELTPGKTVRISKA